MMTDTHGPDFIPDGCTHFYAHGPDKNAVRWRFLQSACAGQHLSIWHKGEWVPWAEFEEICAQEMIRRCAPYPAMWRGLKRPDLGAKWMRRNERNADDDVENVRTRTFLEERAKK